MNSEDDSKDYIRSWSDPPLDAQGKRESKAIVAYIATLHPTRIYSSDLQRAKDIATDAAKACKCPLEVSKDLRPWGVGSFTGKPAKDVIPQLQRYIDNPDKAVPGGGESFNTFKTRVLGAMKRVLAKQQSHDQNVVVITHFRDLKLVEAWLSKGGAEDIDAKVFAANDISPGAGLLLRRERGRWVAKKQAMTQARVGVPTSTSI
jgi:broad specificity phosphatase PhoE